MKDTKNGASILPVFLDDDYVSLLPGEERVLELKIEKEILKDKNVEVHLEGWNTISKIQTLN